MTLVNCKEKSGGKPDFQGAMRQKQLMPVRGEKIAVM
jgi:hypothetical protein